MFNPDMFNLGNRKKHHGGKKHHGASDALKHLKTGDIIGVRSRNTTCQNFTVVGADIVHKTHPDVICLNDQPSPSILIITSNYPFGRLGGDTPLRYVIYAEKTS